MSGGGSSRDTGQSWGGASAPSPCEQLAFSARLQSPQPSVVGVLSPGDVLSVELTSEPAVRAVAPQGLAGHITTRLKDLISCINSGHVFVAVVTVVDGGNVEVRVQPAP